MLAQYVYLTQTQASQSASEPAADIAAIRAMHADSAYADVARSDTAVPGAESAAVLTAAAVAHDAMHADSARADVTKSHAVASEAAAATEPGEGVTWVPLQVTMEMPLVLEALNRLVCKNTQVCPSAFVPAKPS